MAAPSAPVPNYAAVGELLREAGERLRAAGSETARLDAELLLGHVLHVDRASLLAHPEALVGPEQRSAFEAAVIRRETGEPVAYIRGTKEFYGLALMADRRALIPRPETELLVDLALARIREALTGAPRAGGLAYRVWDVGTGGGAVAVALAVESRRRGYGDDVAFVATDVSREALALAVENAVGHGVADAITFDVGDLNDVGAGAVDLVVANLPYVPASVVPGLPIAASFEPRLALDGGDDGLDVLRRLVVVLPDVVRRGGYALLEIGSDQADSVAQMARSLVPAPATTVHTDLGARPRVIELGPFGPR